MVSPSLDGVDFRDARDTQRAYRSFTSKIDHNLVEGIHTWLKLKFKNNYDSFGIY